MYDLPSELLRKGTQPFEVLPEEWGDSKQVPGWAGLTESQSGSNAGLRSPPVRKLP